MTPWRACQREAEMLRNERPGPSADVGEHLRTCAACRESLVIAEFLNADAAPVDEVLPDPGRIYWRARLLQRRALAERATQPIRMVQQLAFAAVTGIIVAVTLIAWRAESPMSRLTTFSASPATDSHVAAAVMLGFAMLGISIVIGWWTAGLDDA
jgi:predicted anti-sigma-YlaC factor YlaD